MRRTQHVFARLCLEKNLDRVDSLFESLCPKMNGILLVKLTCFHPFWVTHYNQYISLWVSEWLEMCVSQFESVFSLYVSLSLTLSSSMSLSVEAVELRDSKEVRPASSSCCSDSSTLPASLWQTEVALEC